MYKYLPLPIQHIRVCELGPGQFDDAIIIALHVERLDPQNPPRYEALSYAWGSNISTSKLRVKNGRDGDGEISVRHNLAIALQHLRYAAKARTLWVDSICIDQSNNGDRSSQVNMMGDIYRLAARVIVWLGPEENNSSRAMDILEDMGSQVQFHPGSFSITPSSQARDNCLGDMTIDLPYREDDLTWLYHLLCRKWFERLWVRQEILLSGSAAIAVCGFRDVPWQTFQRGLACIYLKGRNHFRQDELAERRDLLRTLLFGPESVNLSLLRRDFGMLKCADPRDRVYAILAILRQRSQSLDVQVDYDKSVAQVYEDFVTKYMRNSSDISFLTACNLKGNSLGIPSWIPDWSTPVRTRVETRIWSASAMFASGHLSSQVRAPVDGKLEVIGVMLGAIRELQQIPLEKPMTDDSMVGLVRSILSKEALELDYVAGGSVLEAYIRTMCLEAFAENFSPPLEHLPRLDSSIAVVKQILSLKPGNRVPEHATNAFSLLLSRSHMTLGGRCLYKIDSGYIGLGPMEVQVGDMLFIALGSSLPLILRHVDRHQYRLVGSCYTCGVSRGEGFLGPLPLHVRMVTRLEERRSDVVQRLRRVFVDEGTGKSSMTDPRLTSWPIDQENYSEKVEEGLEHFLTVKPDVLREKGINIQVLTLV